MEFWIDISEIVRNLGLATAAGIGSWLAWRRLSPERDRAQLERRSHVTELYMKAAEQLIDERLEVRLAAIYALREIGNDFPDLADPVFEIAQAHSVNRDAPENPNETPVDMLALMEIVAGRVDQR